MNIAVVKEKVSSFFNNIWASFEAMDMTEEDKQAHRQERLAEYAELTLAQLQNRKVHYKNLQEPKFSSKEESSDFIGGNEFIDLQEAARIAEAQFEIEILNEAIFLCEQAASYSFVATNEKEKEFAYEH